MSRRRRSRSWRARRGRGRGRNRQDASHRRPCRLRSLARNERAGRQGGRHWSAGAVQGVVRGAVGLLPASRGGRSPRARTSPFHVGPADAGVARTGRGTVPGVADGAGEAIVRLLTGIAGESGCVLVLEDLALGRPGHGGSGRVHGRQPDEYAGAVRGHDASRCGHPCVARGDGVGGTPQRAPHPAATLDGRRDDGHGPALSGHSRTPRRDRRVGARLLRRSAIPGGGVDRVCGGRGFDRARPAKLADRQRWHTVDPTALRRTGPAAHVGFSRGCRSSAVCGSGPGTTDRCRAVACGHRAVE